MKIFPIIKKIIQISGGGGVIFGLQAGVAQQKIIATKNAVIKAVGTAHSVFKTAISEQPTGTQQTVIASGDSLTELGEGAVHGVAIDSEPIEAESGHEITKVFVDNTTGYDNSGTAIYAVGADNDWADPTNFDGNDASEASVSGGKGLVSLTAKNGGVRGSFVSPNATKDAQTILSVTLKVYVRQTGTLLGNGTLVWRLTGAIAKALGSNTGDVGQEFTYDLTADVAGDWDNLRGLNIEVEGSSALLGRSAFARYATITVVSEREITL